MNDKDIEVVELAMVWARTNEFFGGNTITEDEVEINNLLVRAFLAGVKYAKDNP